MLEHLTVTFCTNGLLESIFICKTSSKGLFLSDEQKGPPFRIKTTNILAGHNTIVQLPMPLMVCFGLTFMAKNPMQSPDGQT